VKKVFFYDYKSWIFVYNCNITDLKALFYFEIILEKKIIRKGNVSFEFINNKWKLKNKKINKINKDFSWADEIFIKNNIN